MVITNIENDNTIYIRQHITNNVKLFFNKDVTDVVKMYLEATKDLMNWKTHSNKIDRIHILPIKFYFENRNRQHSWLITGIVTRLTWRVPLVEQELLTLPEHLSQCRPSAWARCAVARGPHEHRGPMLIYVCCIQAYFSMLKLCTLPGANNAVKTALVWSWVHPKFLVGFVLFDL